MIRDLGDFLCVVVVLVAALFFMVAFLVSPLPSRLLAALAG